MQCTILMFDITSNAPAEDLVLSTGGSLPREITKDAWDFIRDLANGTELVGETNQSYQAIRANVSLFNAADASAMARYSALQSDPTFLAVFKTDDVVDGSTVHCIIKDAATAENNDSLSLAEANRVAFNDFVAAVPAYSNFSDGIGLMVRVIPDEDVTALHAAVASARIADPDCGCFPYVALASIPASISTLLTA